MFCKVTFIVWVSVLILEKYYLSIVYICAELLMIAGAAVFVTSSAVKSTLKFKTKRTIETFCFFANKMKQNKNKITNLSFLKGY